MHEHSMMNSMHYPELCSSSAPVLLQSRPSQWVHTNFQVLSLIPIVIRIFILLFLLFGKWEWLFKRTKSFSFIIYILGRLQAWLRSLWLKNANILRITLRLAKRHGKATVRRLLISFEPRITETIKTQKPSDHYAPKPRWETSWIFSNACWRFDKKKNGWQWCS